LWALPHVQRLGPASVSSLWVRRARFADWHSPRPCGFPECKLRRSQLSNRPRTLFVLGRPLEFRPAHPSRHGRAVRLLSWAPAPYSTCQGQRSTLSRVLPARYVPSSGFGHPLDGLLPPTPRRFYFAPAALLGFTLRSLLLRGGIRCVSARMLPHTVSPSAIPHAEAGGRHGRPRFLGFDPPTEVPCGAPHD
jgi:hypothetical protein